MRPRTNRARGCGCALNVHRTLLCPATSLPRATAQHRWRRGVFYAPRPRAHAHTSSPMGPPSTLAIHLLAIHLLATSVLAIHQLSQSDPAFRSSRPRAVFLVAKGGISQPLRVGPSTRLGTPSSAADRRSKDWERHVRQTRHARRACHVHAATGRGAPGVTASGKNRRKFSRVRTSSPARPRGQIDGLGVIDRRRRVSRPESGDGALPRPSRDGTRL